jgi:hypothetical protein
MLESPYTDPDFIRGLYESPANEVLLAEYLLQTGGLQLGFGAAGGGSVLAVTEIQATGASTGGGNPCFLGKTMILMADGDSKTIRDVMPGDYVLAFDNRGNIHKAKVLRHFIHGATERVDVRFADGRVTGTNATHPYWAGEDLFIPIGKFKGPALTYVDREWVESKIVSKRTVKPQKPFLLYNLEIEEFQTYIANGDGVHNVKPAGGGSGDL